MQIGETGLEDAETGVCAKLLMRPSNGGGVFIKSVETTLRTKAGQDRLGMTAATKRAIDVNAVSANAKLLYSLRQHDGIVPRLFRAHCLSPVGAACRETNSTQAR